MASARVIALLLSFFAVANCQNLLVNPGCDSQAASDAGPPSGWVVASGDWRCNFRSAVTAPFTAPNFFYAGEVGVAEIYQDVDVSALATEIDSGSGQFVLTMMVRSLGNSGDSVRVQIVSYDGANNQLQRTGNDARAPPDVWQNYVTAAQAAVGTRRLRVHVISTRVGTDDLSNDGYFDDMNLGFVSQQAGGAAPTQTCLTCPANCKKLAIPAPQFTGFGSHCDAVAPGDKCCRDLGNKGHSCPRTSECCGGYCCAPNTFCNTCDNGVFKCLRDDKPFRFIFPAAE